jgi:hypothetical protein
MGACTPTFSVSSAKTGPEAIKVAIKDIASTLDFNIFPSDNECMIKWQENNKYYSLHLRSRNFTNRSRHYRL